jgi:hypothetical protein
MILPARAQFGREVSRAAASSASARTFCKRRRRRRVRKRQWQQGRCSPHGVLSGRPKDHAAAGCSNDGWWPWAARTLKPPPACSLKRPMVCSLSARRRTPRSMDRRRDGRSRRAPSSARQETHGAMDRRGAICRGAAART